MVLPGIATTSVIFVIYFRSSKPDLSKPMESFAILLLTAHSALFAAVLATTYGRNQAVYILKRYGLLSLFYKKIR